jgi:hypothetical protein
MEEYKKTPATNGWSREFSQGRRSFVCAHRDGETTDICAMGGRMPKKKMSRKEVGL